MGRPYRANAQNAVRRLHVKAYRRLRRPCTDCTSRVRSRSGTTLLEVVVAGVILGTIPLIALTTLAAASAQNRDSLARMDALIEAENVIDVFSTRPWNEINGSAGQSMRLSDWAAGQLKGGTLNVQVTELEDSKRIEVTVRWHAGPEQRRDVSLVTWVYRSSARSRRADTTGQGENAS